MISSAFSSGPSTEVACCAWLRNACTVVCANRTRWRAWAGDAELHLLDAVRSNAHTLPFRSPAQTSRRRRGRGRRPLPRPTHLAWCASAMSPRSGWCSAQADRGTGRDQIWAHAGFDVVDVCLPGFRLFLVQPQDEQGAETAGAVRTLPKITTGTILLSCQRT